MREEIRLGLRMQEHGKKKVACVKCSSKDVAQSIMSFFATTSKKS